MFSLGLIFLEMGTLGSIQHVYNRETAKIDETVLLGCYAEFEQRYGESPLLCSAVKNMI